MPTNSMKRCDGTSSRRVSRRNWLVALFAAACCLLLAFAPAAHADSGDFPRNTFTNGKRKYVWVSEAVYDKVTNTHEVPDWLVGRVIYYGRSASFATNYDYEPYYMTVHEYECDNSGCERTGRAVNVRMVIDWTDGKANHGILRTMYCHMRTSSECPGWLRSADPYFGPPGPQMEFLAPQ